MREVEARLKISATDRTGNVLGRVGKQLHDVSRRVDALNRQQSLLARSSNLAYGALSKYLAAGALVYGVKESVVAFADLERQMTRIGTTADASAEQTQAAFQGLQQMSKEMALPLQQAVKGLETLVSSGMDLKQAMEFLPSVLATAQASGADTADIANTAVKAASALKIEAQEMQRAFDIMVAGGKAGQFELKDMAQYIPELANSFATLGYQGEDGLKKLIAILQTMREDTGDASTAATNLTNVLGKIYSEDTAKKFKDMGVDLNAELAKAKKNGEDTVAAFVRISKEAIKGDLTKLPKLFTDQQFRMGMQSLMTSAESYEKFLKAVNDGKVEGTVFRDLKRVTDDTRASIDRLSNSWDKLMRSVGEGSSRILVPAMDAVSKDLDYGEALRRGLEKSGMKSWVERETWIAKNLPFGPFSKSAAADKMALAGGYKDDALKAQYMQGAKLPYGWQRPNMVNGLPVPRARMTREQSLSYEYARAGGGPERYASGRTVHPDLPSAAMDAGYRNPLASFIDRQDAVFAEASEKIKQGAAEGGQALDDEATRRLVSEASAIGSQIGQAVASAIRSAVGNLNVNVRTPVVNANTGKQNPAAIAQPARLGHQ